MPQVSLSAPDYRRPISEIRNRLSRFSYESCTNVISRITKGYLLPSKGEEQQSLSPFFLSPDDSRISLPGLTMLTFLALLNAKGNEIAQPKELLNIQYELSAYAVPLGTWAKRISRRERTRILTMTACSQFYLQSVCEQEPGLHAKIRWMLRDIMGAMTSQTPTSTVKGERELSELLGFHDFAFNLWFLNITQKDTITYNTRSSPKLFVTGMPRLVESSVTSNPKDALMKAKAIFSDWSESEPSSGKLLPESLIFLTNYPFVRCGEDFVLPVHHFLLTHVYDGLYYRLLDRYRDSVAIRMGYTYQNYLWYILSISKNIGVNAVTEPDLRLQVPNYEGKLPDAILYGDKTAVLIEFKATRIPLIARMSGEYRRAHTLLTQISEGALQLHEFAQFLMKNDTRREIYKVLVLWEEPWYWFARYNWEHLWDNYLRANLPTEYRCSGGGNLVLTSLSGMEFLVALEEAHAAGALVSAEDCLRSYLVYLAHVRRTPDWIWTPLSNKEIADSLYQYAANRYLEQYAPISIDSPKGLKVIFNNFKSEVIERLRDSYSRR